MTRGHRGISPIKAAGSSEASTSTATVSVSDFLDLVKDTHRSILSDDVLNRLNLERPADGYYTDRVRHSVDNAATETDSNHSLQSDQQREAKTDSADAAVEAEQENAKADKAPVENSLAPSGKYDKTHPNKIAEWVAKDAAKVLHGMGVENAQVTVDYEMDKASNGYYVVKDGKRQIVLNGQLGGTTRNGQVYSAQQNIQFIVAHEIGHLAQGVGYTGETNLYTDQIINLYQESTGTTDAEVEDGIQRVMDRYLAEAERSGSSLNISRSDVTTDYARGEYAADRLAEMLGQYNTLRKIAKNQNRNIIQKALSLVGKFQGSLVSKLRSHANKNEITWVDIAEIYDEAASNLEKILRDSMENAGKMKIAEENNSTPRRYVIDESNGLYVSDEDIQAGIREVSQMESVSNISGEGFKKGEVDLTTQVAEFFKENGGIVANEQVGNIVMDRRSAKDDIAHGIGRKKQPHLQPFRMFCAMAR